MFGQMRESVRGGLDDVRVGMHACMGGLMETCVYGVYACMDFHAWGASTDCEALHTCAHLRVLEREALQADDACISCVHACACITCIRRCTHVSARVTTVINKRRIHIRTYTRAPLPQPPAPPA